MNKFTKNTIIKIVLLSRFDLMLYKCGQFLVHIFKFAFVYQIVYLNHQYLQLRTNVHYKKTREATYRRRDRAFDESREELHEEHDLVSGAELHVEQNKVIRAG